MEGVTWPTEWPESLGAHQARLATNLPRAVEWVGRAADRDITTHGPFDTVGGGPSDGPGIGALAIAVADGVPVDLAPSDGAIAGPGRRTAGTSTGDDTGIHLTGKVCAVLRQ